MRGLQEWSSSRSSSVTGTASTQAACAKGIFDRDGVRTP